MSKKLKKKEKPKVKDKDNSENFDYMKSTKDSLKNIVKDNNIYPIIFDLVNRTNKIVIHSYQFLKLYFIYLHDNHLPFPKLDKEYICDIFKVVTKRQCNKGAYTENNMPQQLKTLTDFYESNYKNTIFENEVIYYDKLSYILAYEAIDMITNIENNIKEHFPSHVCKYVNLVFDVKTKSKEITKNYKDKEERKVKHKDLYDEIQKVKNDLLIFKDELTSDPKYHEWVQQTKRELYNGKTVFDENSVYYDVKSNTQDYIKSMFYLVEKIEEINKVIIEENKKIDLEDIDDKIKKEKKKNEIKLFNVLPLRTNIIPKNICIDTCGLISNFLGNLSTSEHLKNYKKDNNQFDLWNTYFHLHKPVFKKKKYLFHYMIYTDGISVSINFIRKDIDGNPLKKTIKNKKCCEDENIEYVEKAELTDEIKSKRVVCIDPGKSDLIYCGCKDQNDNLLTFRYTQNQRRMESKNKKYNKIIYTINTESKIDDKTIIEIQSSLSNKNSKKINYNDFYHYLIEKNKMNITLYNHYKQKVFRKLKFNRYINTQKSESKMMKNFSKKMGKPEDTIIVMGDYDSENHHMKGKEPVICKRFRRIFRNHGYKTYLINEYRTSKLCNCCHNELEKFMIRLSHKPKLKRENKNEEVHGILRCKSIKSKCEIIHNRDKNAVQNMLNIVKSIFLTGKRPEKFCRTAK